MLLPFYDVENNGDGTYTVICADSDNNLDSPKREERIVRLKEGGSFYEIQTKNGYQVISEAVILTNDIDDDSMIHQDYSNLNVDSLRYYYYPPEKISQSQQDPKIVNLIAMTGNADGLDYIDGIGFVLTSDVHAEEVLVKSEGNLLIESGATIDEIYVQPGASATLNEGGEHRHPARSDRSDQCERAGECKRGAVHTLRNGSERRGDDQRSGTLR